MTDQEVLYRAADKLSHDALAKFLKTNNIDEHEYMKHRIRLLAQQPTLRVTRAAKAKILREQDGRCAFCHDPIPHGYTVCYNHEHTDVLCRRCSMTLSCLHAILQAGITWDMLQARLVPPIKYVGCENCKQYHKEDFVGDCCNNADRFTLNELLTAGISGSQIIEQS